MASEITNVRLLAMPESETLSSNQFPPQRIRSEEPEKTIAIINARDRISGNGCNFTVDMLSEITRVRLCRIGRVILPKIPTINPRNATISVVHVNGSGSISLDYGFYNINSLCNALTSKLNTLFASFSDTVQIVYDPRTRVISITSVSGLKWYFLSTCSFIQYGLSVHGFTGLPSGTPASSGAISWFSSSCGLIYSRLITIRSRALQSYIRTPSRNSRGELDIVATCSIVQDYTADDFDSSSVFTGNLLTERTDIDSPVFLCAGPRFASLKVIDFGLEDEYGFDLYGSINISESNENSFNAVIWLVFSM